jgi:CheY-like chemotaxis protein
MSLVGNLEDLSLPDILQIVSLSRKSGILMLEREGQQGKILIRQGKVIQTISPRPGRTLGELLTARGLVRPDDLKKALDIQRSGGGRELLGGILVQLKLIDEATLEKVVQEQIEDAIVFFLTWREGTFSFELADIQGRGEFSVDPQAFILERGIDTQWLVLEGTRLIDERARERSGHGAAAPAVPEPAGETSFADLETEPEAAAAGRALILVDDDPLFLQLAGGRLGALGFRVQACETVGAALSALEREAAGPEPPAVVSDIVMPTLDSQGFLGGLELLEKVRRAHPEVSAVAVTAYPDENVREQVVALGARFLLKPGAGDQAGLAGFFAKLDGLLGKESAVPVPQPSPAPVPVPAAKPAPPPAAAPAPGPAPEPAAPPAPPTAAPAGGPAPIAWEAELPPAEPSAGATWGGGRATAPAPVAPALPAPAPPEPAAKRPPQATDALAATRAALARQEQAVAEAALPPAEAALLRDMLEELQNPRATSEIGLLILRFAAELLNRAVLFVVKGGKAVGLGGFGVEAPGGPERRGIRAIAIPLDEPSVLEAVVRRRGPVQGRLEASAQNRALVEQLGGAAPLDAVALPLVSGGRVRVILYGDNLPEQRPVAGARALELFLAQAGLMLEKVLLEKKLHESGAAAVPAGRREHHVGGGSR